MGRKKRKIESKPKKTKRRSRRSRSSGDTLNINPKVLRSIAGLLFYLGIGILILSFFSDGLLLTAVNRIVTTLFGWQKYMIPVLFFFSGNILLKPSAKLSRPTLLLGSVIILLTSGSLFKAGSIGEEFWVGLVALVSGLGAFMIYSVGLVIGLMVFWEISFADIIQFFASIGERITFSSKPGDVVVDDGSEAKVYDSAEAEWQKEPLLKHPPAEPSPPVSKSEVIPAMTESVRASMPAPDPNFVWQQPPLSLLSSAVASRSDGGDVRKNADTIESTFASFGVQAKVEEIHKGPAVTQYAIRPAIGTKLTKITSLSNDLALALAAKTGQIRIEAPIPGKSLVGIEVPNVASSIVPLRQLLASPPVKSSHSKLLVGLGVDVNNTPMVMDIAKMPHLLIAGQTGSGKSVCINVLIMSILFRATPQEVKFILVDPKRVELSAYNGIPHLLTPVIVEPDKVLSALKWAIEQMNERYKIFAEVGAKNLESYNQMAGFAAMPYIAIVIDELADIMLYAPAEVEDAINRLAQMARATGIHLILATQRPSVDVITGLIKANIPARIAFSVSSMMDSRVILDTPGAEKLMGRGDMLFIPPDQAKPRRIQGTIVTDAEIQRVTEFLKRNGVATQYTEEITKKYKGKTGKPGAMESEAEGEVDPLFEDSVRIVCGYDKASSSLLQRKLKIGYNRAARIIDQLHDAGVVGAADGSKAREVLTKNADEFLVRWEAAQNQ